MRRPEALREDPMAEALAERLGRLSPEPARESLAAPRVPAHVLGAVGEALRSGETHYTSRPGILELRLRLAEEIRRRGGPVYDPAKGVVVTAGEEEALFVTLLALAPGPGDVIVVFAEGRCRHLGLFRLMGLEPLDYGSGSRVPPQARILYRDTNVEFTVGSGLAEILNLGETLGSPLEEMPRWDPERTTVLGSLDSLAGLASFRVGFVAGPEPILTRVQTWKQALSICTAGPSQRAALAAFERREAS